MYNLKKIYGVNVKSSTIILSKKSQSTLCTMDDIPRPNSLPFIGTKLDLIAAGSGKKLHKYVNNRHKQLGPIFSERLSGNTDLVFLSDPELIKTLFIKLEGKYPSHILPDPWILYEKMYGSKRGLFFMNGEEWLQNRRIANKHLLRDDAEKLISPAIVESVERFITQLKGKCSKELQVNDMESELYQLSTSVIIHVLLGKNTLKHSRHHEELLQIFAASVKKIFQVTTKLYVWPVNWCQRLNLKVWRDFKECVDLSLLLANKMASEMIKNGDKSNGLINKLIGENMKNEDIIRVIADFIIAAGDTTAYTTLWILLLLCKNKNVVNDIRSKEDDYVKFVVKEGMRLYPVAPFLTRILPEKTFLGRYEVNEQTPIIASIYTTGRDEQYFSHAQSFLPYRWDRNDSRKANLANHVPSASLPFALGARSCVGKKIAMMQLIEVISKIVKNFDFQCNNKENISSITSQVLIPDKCIQFSFTVRNKH